MLLLLLPLLVQLLWLMSQIILSSTISMTATVLTDGQDSPSFKSDSVRVESPVSLASRRNDHIILSVPCSRLLSSLSCTTLRSRRLMLWTR